MHTIYCDTIKKMNGTEPETYSSYRDFIEAIPTKTNFPEPWKRLVGNYVRSTSKTDRWFHGYESFAKFLLQQMIESIPTALMFYPQTELGQYTSGFKKFKLEGPLMSNMYRGEAPRNYAVSIPFRPGYIRLGIADFSRVPPPFPKDSLEYKNFKYLSSYAVSFARFWGGDLWINCNTRELDRISFLIDWISTKQCTLMLTNLPSHPKTGLPSHYPIWSKCDAGNVYTYLHYYHRNEIVQTKQGGSYLIHSWTTPPKFQ